MILGSDTIKIPHPPTRWRRIGRVMERDAAGGLDSSVVGDPCVVWDDEASAYRMFYFAQRHLNGAEVNGNGMAIAAADSRGRPGVWQKQGPLEYVNPEALGGDTHKPFIVMDPYRPNHAARIRGRFVLLTVTYRGRHKVIHRAWSSSLAGPWTVQAEPVVSRGHDADFDAYHVDSVTAYHFPDRDAVLLFYKGYPAVAQADQPASPFGSSNAVAVIRGDASKAEKLGPVLRPSATPGHWTGGLIAALQLLPATDGGWWGLINAGPTPPAPVDVEPVMREPAPSLGGWAYTPEAWPTRGWRVADEPIEWIDQLPPEAIAEGEGVNLWRHHALVTPDGRLYLYYNSGSYGQEQLYGRLADLPRPVSKWRPVVRCRTLPRRGVTVG